MTVLVTVASKHGSTAELAQALADGLIRRGAEAVVRSPDDVVSVRGYDAVVLGSAVYAGHWLPAATAFVDRLRDELLHTHVWLFSSGPVGDPPKPAEDAVDVAGQLAGTGAVEHRTFAGRLERTRLGFAERAIVRALRVPDGDFRDWTAVDAWAGQIAAALQVARPCAPASATR